MGKDTEIVYIEQRAYNYMLIMKMWKKLYGSYGKNLVKNNKFDFDSLYAVLERSKDTLKSIVKGDYTYDATAVEKNALSVEKKTGIPKGYLTGEELIILPSIKDSNTIIEYMGERQSVDDLREEISNILDRKIRDKELQAIMQGKGEVPAQVKKEIDARISQEKETKLNVDAFDKKLDTAIKQFLSDEWNPLIQDEKLNCLRFFLVNKKRIDSINVQNIRDVMDMMKRTRTWQLMDIKSVLKEYIAVLEEHTCLVKAVYKVAQDTGDIED